MDAEEFPTMFGHCIFLPDGFVRKGEHGAGRMEKSTAPAAEPVNTAADSLSFMLIEQCGEKPPPAGGL